MAVINAFFFHQGGAAAVQYALVAGILSLAILAGSLLMRESLISLYEGVGEQTSEALVASPAE